MLKSQLSLSILRQDGKPDGRSMRWKKTASFTQLYRQGKMGGCIRYRKSQRPFDSKKAQHLVLKSDQCRAGFNFTHPSTRLVIEEMARDLAKKSRLTLYKIAIAHNHIHILVHGKRREASTRFLKSFSGVLAKRMKKWAKAKNIKLTKERFWSARPYSDLVSFGRHWRNVLKYLEKNRNEALGFVAYTERNHAIQKVIAKIYSRLEKSRLRDLAHRSSA